MNIAKHSCGCLTQRTAFNITISISKCYHHMAMANAQGLVHHTEMVGDGNHVKELCEALLHMNASFPTQHDSMLEVGCGIGTYVQFFKDAGWKRITGVEPDGACAKKVCRDFYIPVHISTFENFYPMEKYNLVFAAHVFEHMADVFAMFHKVFAMLEDGGRFVLVIPDDTDLLNPDHKWFFNQAGLKDSLEYVGFTNIKMCEFQRIQREKFIYCVAEKP